MRRIARCNWRRTGMASQGRSRQAMQGVETGAALGALNRGRLATTFARRNPVWLPPRSQAQACCGSPPVTAPSRQRPARSRVARPASTPSRATVRRAPANAPPGIPPRSDARGEKPFSGAGLRQLDDEAGAAALAILVPELAARVGETGGERGPSAGHPPAGSTSLRRWTAEKARGMEGRMPAPRSAPRCHTRADVRNRIPAAPRLSTSWSCRPGFRDLEQGPTR